MGTDGRIEIVLTRGLVAIIDEQDYEIVAQYKWWPTESNGRMYAVTQEGHKQPQIRMHRLILGITDDSVDVDHIDGNGFHNWRSNLRLATRSQNNMNAKKRSDTTSQFKGVAWRRKEGLWTAQIGYEKKVRHLGYFYTEQEAAKAYNAAAIELFGEYARLNVIE